MAYTNEHNLPEEIVKCLTKNRYSGSNEDKNSFSVTTLIAPVQQTILKRRYPDCDTYDVIDNLWSMFGSIAHTLLEEHGSDGAIVEQRFYTNILGKTVSGGVDNYKSGIITDYKVTSVWKVQKKNYSEWTQQLNAYAHLLRENGYKVNSIRIIAILRDWSAPEGYKPDYPKAPIEIIDIPLWEEHKTAIYLSDRVRLLKIAEQNTDDFLLPCTNEEMWCKESKWAVMKPEGKRATKVFDTKEEAENFLLENPALIMVERQGERRRCAKYCQVASVCYQNQQYLKERDIGKSESTELVF